MPERGQSERLREAAEMAVFATLPLLPLNGSDGRGYRVADLVSTTLVATAEEWSEAAHAIAELHRALREET